MSAAGDQLDRYIGCLGELISLLEDQSAGGDALRRSFQRSEQALRQVGELHDTASEPDPGSTERAQRAVRLNAIVADLAARRSKATQIELNRTRQAVERLGNRSIPSSALGRLCDLAG